MNTKNTPFRMVGIFVVMMMVAAFTTVALQAQVKPVVKKPILKKDISKKPVMRKLIITSFVTVNNCVDRYLEVKDLANCKNYKVHILPDMCRQLGLKYWDKVRVQTETPVIQSNVTEVKAVKVTKLPWDSLDGVVTSVNCVDHYVDMDVSKCGERIKVRIYFGRDEDCRRYNIRAGERIRVFGRVAHEADHTREWKLTVANVTRIQKL